MIIIIDNKNERSLAVPDTKKSYRIKKKLMEDTFVVPRKLIKRLSEAGQHELKIFLVLAALEDTEDYYTEETLFAEVSEYVTEAEFSEGLAFLRGAGLLEQSNGTRRKSEKKEKEAPQIRTTHRSAYTSEFLAKEAGKSEFGELVNYATMRLGKSFSTAELSTLYSFKDQLLLPCDVIMLGIEHCASEGKASLRYIEKFLLDFADRGITDYDSAEEYIRSRKSYLSFEGKIRALAGIDKRTLTPREKAFISSWQEMNFPFDMIKLAYDKTVDNTKEFSMRYMNKILENWKNAGFKTAHDVETGDRKPDAADSGDSFNLDDFFKAAVERNQ